jgi:hypothetical protein
MRENIPTRSDLSSTAFFSADYCVTTPRARNSNYTPIFINYNTFHVVSNTVKKYDKAVLKFAPTDSANPGYLRALL